ncbi:hypothetical protein BC829DRAFT_404380, partial [Chytridium lagenaria]
IAGVLATVPLVLYAAFLAYGYITPVPINAKSRREIGPASLSFQREMITAGLLSGPPTKLPIAVIGGGGFVGAYIVESLIHRGESNILILDISPPKMSSHHQPLRGMKIVYHVAAILSFQENLNSNFPRTKNVIQACVEAGAEKITLLADKTVGPTGRSLEPPLIVWGAGDRFNVDRIIKDKGGIMIGNLLNDYVYVENKALRENPDTVGGQAFLVSENDPILESEFFKLIKLYVKDLTIPTKLPRFLFWTLSLIGTSSQWIFAGKVSMGELDALSLAVYKTVNHTYTFRSDKIRRVVGYRPIYTLEEAMRVALYRKGVLVN